MKSALVTGANGLLGSHLVRNLREKGVLVYALVRDFTPSEDSGLKYIQIDLGTDFDSSLLPSGVDTIFHVAQAREYRDFPNHANSVFMVNTLSTSKLLEYANRAGVKSFVYASSGGVYEDSRNELRETDPIKSHLNLGNYFTTKVASEALVFNYKPLMKIAILRYFFIYGAGQNRLMMIPRIYDRVRDQEALQIQGNDGLSFNPIHATDAAEATIMASLHAESILSNVAGPESITLRQMAEIFGRHLGQLPLFEFTSGEGPSIVAATETMGTFFQPKLRIKDSIEDIAL
jgi:UDP-glucose 4-epimerase